MKWLVFTGAFVAALIWLGVKAVEERDALWEGRSPLCPYCREELNAYALACRHCARGVDWNSTKESCRWCLSGEDVKILRDGVAVLKLDKGDPLPEFTRPYLLSIETGDCTYCGGLGSVMNGQGEMTCPVCRGDKRCIACKGGGKIVIGDEQAHQRALERKQAWQEALRREALTHLKLRRKKLVDEDVKALRGFAEVETVMDEAGDNLLERASARIARAFEAIHDAVEQTPPPATAD